METKIKILIVDDNPQFVKGLEFMLCKHSDFELLGKADNGEKLLDHPMLSQANIILLDIEMPGLDGFATAKKVNWKFSYIKLIAITMYQENVYLEELIRVGFRGFVNKTDIATKLIDVIYSVNENKFIFPEQILHP
jgi:DNA-binding NarL/FixJ family response regulator